MAENKTEQPGRFEHYRVMTDADGKPIKLGEGAMGVTYLAEDTNLRVKVALKVIAPNLLGDTEIVQRFQREAQAAARLRHPNVAAVYHLGEVDDTFFYTMEFVEGRTLREHVAENGPLTIPQALAVTLQMAEALGAAERHQMVHRDIKPANIMLETTDDGLHAKLIDFGLAKPLQHDAQQTSALLTQRGTFLGTAVFASPEQVQDLPLDTRSDFYALGLTMWVMLEGRPPFEGSLHKVLYDQVHTKPPLDRLLWVPAEVRELLAKLLEKQPSARPQTARELRQMIHDCQRATATTTTGQADWQRRFQVRQASRPQPWGTIYEGEDSLSGAVWLHFLRSDRFGSTETLNGVIAGVRKAIEIHHPNVLRHVTVFPASDPQGAAGWIVVTEHPGAHTLLGHLQQVKQLTAAEAFPLIERLAEALDCCLASDLHSAEMEAARIYLKPQTPPGGSGPVEVVPKLIPVDYRFSTTLSGDNEAELGMTQIVPRSEAKNAADAVHRLATLAYQCLGGSWGRMTRYIPLPGLTQHQNETLREALTTKKYTRGADLVDALRQTKMPRRTAAAPPTVEEATVTLSPWERLAAIAAPQTGAEDPTVLEQKTGPAAVESRTRAPQSLVEAPEAAPEVQEQPEPVTGDAAVAEAPSVEQLPISDAPATAFEREAEQEVPPSLMDGDDAAAAPEEELQMAEEPAPAVMQAPIEELPSGTGTASPATSAGASAVVPAPTQSVRTRATELPLPGQPSQSAENRPISVLRKAVEREWRDAKPILDKVATPVRQTVTTLPRWVFVAFGTFVAVVAVGLWMIANRSVGNMSQAEAGPVNNLAAATVDDTKPKATATVTPPPPPPPPVQASLDQLLDSGTEAASRGDAAKLLPIWTEMRTRFPDRRWSSLSKSGAFVTAVAGAWQQGKLGDASKAAHDYLPILTLAAKGNDIAMLKKLSADLQEDAAAAQPFELSLLTALVDDKEKSEMLLDESLRLINVRKTGAVADRARDLIRQSLEPLVNYRERWKRPDDMDTALRSGMKALTPKFEALAATGEPAALYLYADKLRADKREAEAITHFERAAQRDHAPSMLQLGLLLSNAKDKAKSLPQAAYWFGRADSLGYPQATFLLGECYLDGKGVSRDYAQALNKLEAAAAHNIPEAHYMLAETYMGNTPANPPSSDNFDPARLNSELKGEARLAKAREHLESARKYGYARAGGLLAQLLITGQGGPRDVARGMQLLDETCKMPDPDPAILRSHAYLLMPTLPPGVPVTRKDLDDAKVKPDKNRVEQLMRQAARAGDAAARQWCESERVKY